MLQDPKSNQEKSNMGDQKRNYEIPLLKEKISSDIGHADEEGGGQGKPESELAETCRLRCIKCMPHSRDIT